jgi:cell filamentation protein, protein adenylyltransferase
MNETVDRTYLRTHPWLSFYVDLRQAPMELWMLLGEARSKVQHLGESLLDPETGARLREVYLAKGVHATTAIEGNTLSEDEVAEHLAGRLNLPASQEYRTREIDNIVNAYNRIRAELFGEESRELTPAKIKEYNRLILDELPVDEGVIPGEMATRPPVVGRYRAPPREDCDYLLEQLCEWLNGENFVAPNEEMMVPYAIIKAVLAHLYLAWIHYFGDGNGRTARCVELQILLATGRVSTPAAHLLSNHYNITRDDYYRQLDAASRDHDGSPLGFLAYAVRGFVDQLRVQLQNVWVQLCQDRWEQYVYQQFGDTKKPPDIRQRQLVLDLSKQDEPVSRAKLRNVSPKVASAYAKRGEKTLTRDLNALAKRDLIIFENGGYRPRREKILSLLPDAPPAS